MSDPADEITALEAEANLTALLRRKLTPIMQMVRQELPPGTHILLAVDLGLEAKGLPVVTIATDRGRFVPLMRDWADKVEREAREG